MNDAERGALWVVGAITAVAIAATLAVGIWRLGWFIEEKNTEQRVHIINKSPGTQTAWHDEVLSGIAEIPTLPEGSPARMAIIRKTCTLAGRLSPEYRDDDILAFQDQNC